MSDFQFSQYGTSSNAPRLTILFKSWILSYLFHRITKIVEKFLYGFRKKGLWAPILLCRPFKVGNKWTYEVSALGSNLCPWTVSIDCGCWVKLIQKHEQCLLTHPSSKVHVSKCVPSVFWTDENVDPCFSVPSQVARLTVKLRYHLAWLAEEPCWWLGGKNW